MGTYLFTSESVTEGHPDKIADQISDTVLDAILTNDPHGRVACETLVTTGLVFISGEITTDTYVDFTELVRGTIKRIGYIDASMGFDYQTCAVLSSVGKQSPDIAQGVDEDSGLHKELGAGDQGMMFGYAVDETEELMPLPIQLAHQLTRRMAQVRHEGELPFLRPDGKSQVTIKYDEATHKPIGVQTVVLSTQHDEAVSLQEIRESLKKHVIKPILPDALTDYDDLVIHVNPTGRFVIGGPMGDAGLTGRKIIADTYGGAESHGGGCFSGKDPTKVDRSAAYAARYIAKNIVKAGLAQRCSVQLAYAIGVAEPISVYVNTHGTGKLENDRLTAIIREHFPLKPRDIIDHFNLLTPIYKNTAVYGHFGRPEFPWEKTDIADELVNLL